MNRKILAVAAAAFFMLIAPASRAQDAATKDDAVKMVKAVVAEMNADGHYKTLNDISDPHGKYIKGDLYIVAYNFDGKCVAHGGDLSLIGKDLSDQKDVDGKAFVRERITLAQTQSNFWQTYKSINPVTHAVDVKNTYCETADDLIVCGGVYGQ
jgi:signal transduction histidine kinase